MHRIALGNQAYCKSQGRIPILGLCLSSQQWDCARGPIGEISMHAGEGSTNFVHRLRRRKQAQDEGQSSRPFPTERRNVAPEDQQKPDPDDGWNDAPEDGVHPLPGNIEGRRR